MAKAKKRAREATPVMVVAKAMNLDPQRLRYRMAYYGQPVKGASIAQIIGVLKERHRGKLPRKVLKLLDSGGEHPPPDVRINPHEATGPPPTELGTTDEDAGYMALDEAKTLSEGNIGNGSYGRLELCVLFAAQVLPAHRRRRKKR